ncbi:glycosyl transferase [Acuticoccus sediminis]|uniref:Glycosyl transferase n=1 Tax=Acuticoccus sediminis TaxID=2184697 RepID=A0A8B2NS04_9HYPH|nr:glycosyltransferase family 2 protein [Acuticoccus sediminis]RAH98996.1 glycosyl transferase [Acuticoccus sediminis]
MVQPLVSIVLPVFNAHPYIDAALRSLRNQTHRELEIIAIDDGSTDGSPAILRRHAAEDPRIVLVSRENRGLVATLNEGLGRATGRYVARMDADDIAYPHRIERQLAAFAARPGLGICGSGFDTIRRDRLRQRHLDPMFRRCDLGILSLFFTVFIHPTVMFDRAVAGSALAYDPAYPHAEDFDLFRRLTGQVPALMIEESLIAYRLHEGSVSQRHKTEMRRTHVRIVTETLAADGFDADFAAFAAAASEVEPGSVAPIADFLEAIGRQAALRPPETSASYAAGLRTFFYFLFGTMCDHDNPRIVPAFLDRTAGWSLIRRRERAIYGGLSRYPALVSASRAASDMMDWCIDAARARPVRTPAGGVALT